MMTTLPTGETLPEYDDGPADGVDVVKMREWLVKYRSWGGSPGMNDPLIRDVLAALQAVGDATLVKNPTYRAMRQDGMRIEHLTARLANTGRSGLLVEHGGDPVSVVLAMLAEFDADVTVKPT
jgi:hypothetical protein